MKEHIGDRVFDGATERLEKVLTTLRKEFKNTKPFRQEKTTDEELYYIYRNELTRADDDWLTQKWGVTEYGGYIMELEGKVRGKKHA